MRREREGPGANVRRYTSDWEAKEMAHVIATALTMTHVLTTSIYSVLTAKRIPQLTQAAATASGLSWRSASKADSIITVYQPGAEI